jgi:magnesium transporter
MEAPVIQAYALRSGRIERTEVDKAAPLAGDSLWLDLVRPTPEERGQVEAVYGLTLPTPEEVREIEPSDRLYSEGLARWSGPRCASTVATENPGW